MTGDSDFSGILVVDKPSGATSHDVVDRVRKVYQLRKVGHAGTLDPAATGVLVVGIGRATRLMSFLQALPKCYRAVAKFGVSTSTQDAEGEVIEEKPSNLGLAEIESAAGGFRGEIRQIPPMVSAVKIRGVPLYKRARRGEEVDRKPRSVRVYDFDIEDFDHDSQVAKIFVRCSSGTYVRTLAADLGDRLGVGAHLLSLRRLAVGSFQEIDAVTLEELESIDLKASLQRVLSMSEGMRDFPRITVTGDEIKAVLNGRALDLLVHPVRAGELQVTSVAAPGQRPPHEAGMTSGVPVAVLDPQGNLLAVYRRTKTNLRPEAVLA